MQQERERISKLQGELSQLRAVAQVSCSSKLNELYRRIVQEIRHTARGLLHAEGTLSGARANAGRVRNAAERFETADLRSERGSQSEQDGRDLG